MTLLNDANAVYIGANAADKIYAGTQLVWSKTAPPVGAGFPIYLFAADGAAVFDPGNPANLDIFGSGAPIVYGGPVGEIKAEATTTSASLRQNTLDARPLLRRVNNRDCVEFDGVDDSLFASMTLSAAFATPPKTLTLFVSVYLHTAVSGQTGFALEGSGVPNVNSRHLLTTSASGCRAGVRFATTAFANNVIWEDLATLGVWMDLFWELDIQQMQIAAVGTGQGTIKTWLNEEPMLSTAVIPNRTSNAASATFNYLSLGSARTTGTTPAEWCACTIGKSGFARRALTSDERTQIKAWMRSPVYTPPILVAP